VYLHDVTAARGTENSRTGTRADLHRSSEAQEV